MTNEEALDYFEHDIENLKEQQFYDENDTAIAADLLAIDALEKQIPKRILYNTGDWAYQCPTCRSIYEDAVYPKDYYNFCPCCGQALDWTSFDSGVTE